tara:strand:- start:1808 stop:2518 length:711 start_codon:yes stop_codon:yes gene_type:complete
MKAIIMAAGKGNRISSISNDLPKSFLEINGKRIFDHQINCLREAGVEEIIVVVGYKADLFMEAYSETDITFIVNPFYERCNVLGSLWFALKHLNEGFYFLHADVYFDKSIFFDLKNDDRDCVLCVEPKITIEEEMKVRILNNNIIEINKEMDCKSAFGEFTGIAKIKSKASKFISSAIKNRIEKMGSLDSFFEMAIQDCIDENLITVDYIDIGDRVSIEIDFPEDYKKAIDLKTNL